MHRTLVAVVLAALLAGCGGSSSNGKETGSALAEGPPGAQTVTVGMHDNLTFAPSTVNAKVGSLTITVTNDGQVPHNLTFADGALGKTKTVDGKQSVPLKVVFDKAGTFRFTCTFHSGMVGKVVVS